MSLITSMPLVGFAGDSVVSDGGGIDSRLVERAVQKLLVSGGPLATDAGGASVGNVSPVSRDVMDGAAKLFEQFLQSSGRNIGISVDDVSGAYVLRVMEKNSGALVRQIPSDEVLALMRYFSVYGKSTLVNLRA